VPSIALVAILLSCSTTDDADKPSTTSSSLSEASPSQYVLPPTVGTYTTVWSADPGVDITIEPISLIRATVEAKAIADMVGRNASYPGYGRLLDEGTSTRQGKNAISVEDTPAYPAPIALNGTKRYGIYDIQVTDTAVAARVCDISFGTYQSGPAQSRTIYDPADLRKVTEPTLLDSEGHIPSYIRGWRVRLDRVQPSVTSLLPSRSATDEPSSIGVERYPNYDVFGGWQLREFSINPFAEPRCDAWANEFYPMSVVGSKGLAYPTNPVDPAYLPTLPPYPGWKHVPAD
jgi:hypothetical protein